MWVLAFRKRLKTFIMKGVHYGRIKIYYGEVRCIGVGFDICSGTAMVRREV